MSDKTEQPTPKKLRDARKKGQVAKSKEVVSAALLVVIFGLMIAFMGAVLTELGDMILAPATVYDLEFEQAASALLDEVLWTMFLVLVPFIAATALVGILGNVAQVGLLFSSTSVQPKLSNLNPGAAVKKIFSKNNLVEFLKSVVKIGFLSLLLFLVVRNAIGELVQLPACTVDCVPAILGVLLIRVMQYTIAAFVLVAAADYAWQKYSFIQQHKMTKDEVKREYKESEGDPHVKGARRQFAAELVQQQSDERVKRSSVVVTNPTHIAVALEYTRGKTPLPLVRQTGEGIRARRMVQIAKRHAVPVMQNVPVARGIFENGNIDQYIPSDMVQAVAEVMRFVQELNREPR